MIENKVFSLPIGYNKYILRSTNKEVEVVSFSQKEDGARSDEDWVTYIDSDGKEHIKENLNIQLDFKLASNEFWNKFNDLTTKFPSTRNNRIFELTKELIVRQFPVEEAIKKATEVVDKLGIEYTN